MTALPARRGGRVPSLLIGALGALLLLALLTSFYAFVRVAERGRFATPYSTYGAGPEGAHALLLLAQRLGYSAQPFTRELTHLPRGTLVALGGCRAESLRKISRPEREAVARWVEAGGLLISVGVADIVPTASGLLLQGDAACEQPTAANGLESLLRPAHGDATNSHGERPRTAEAAGPPLHYLLPFNVREARAVRLGHDAEATEILRDEQGTLGLTAPYGRGRVVLLGIPEALTNGALSDGGGQVFARLLRAFAPEGPVLFDEYHLGMGERRSVIGYVRDLGYGPLLLQGLLALVVTLLSLAVRVAPVREAGPRPLRVERSFFDPLSALLAESQDTRAALALLQNAALARIARHYHAPAVPPHKLAAWLKLRGLFAVAHYAQSIEQRVSEPLASGESLVTRAQAIDQDEAAAIAIGNTGFAR